MIVEINGSTTEFEPIRNLAEGDYYLWAEIEGYMMVGQVVRHSKERGEGHIVWGRPIYESTFCWGTSREVDHPDFLQIIPLTPLEVLAWMGS